MPQLVVIRKVIVNFNKQKPKKIIEYNAARIIVKTLCSIRYVQDTSFTKFKKHRLHFLSRNLKQNSDYHALERHNENGTKN
jgi:hypothetical protein